MPDRNINVPQYFIDSRFNNTFLGNIQGKDASLATSNLTNYGHGNAENLSEAFRRNLAYIARPDLVGQDIQEYVNLLGDRAIDPETVVSLYNSDADIVRNFWKTPHNYGDDASLFNPLFKRLFPNRSLVGNYTQADFNIGYQTNLENTVGSSTWLRGMDIYKDEFNGQSDRIHTIKLPNGKEFKVYKKANGDIALYNPLFSLPGIKYDKSMVSGLELLSDSLPDLVLYGMDYRNHLKNINLPSYGSTDYDYLKRPEQFKIETPWKPDISPVEEWGNLKVQDIKNGSIGGGVKSDGSNKITGRPLPDKEGGFFNNLFGWMRKGLPSILELGNYFRAINDNNRVAEIERKGLSPVLLQTYNLYGQVTGDEGTRLNYYRRASQIQTNAALPRTSDATLQNAMSMEGYTKANDLRALGDLADNLRIRETQVQSDKLAWGNTERATTVANYNRNQLAQYRKNLADLEAGRITANGTSADNLFKGIIQRLRVNNEKARTIEDELYLSIWKDQLLGDEKYQQAIRNLHRDPTNPEYKKEYNRLYRQKYRQLLEDLLRRSSLIFTKEGGKIERKYDTKLAYKDIRDSISHFRKIYKMTTDDTRKSKSKPVKLKSRNTTRKMLLGGTAPFRVYTPVPIGESGSYSRSTSSTSSKSSSKDKNESLDLIKELFKELVGKGLPNDVDIAYKEMSDFFALQETLGDTFDSDDISTMYLSMMRRLNNILHSKANYDRIRQVVERNNALNEYAITDDGRVLDRNLNLVKIEDMKPGEAYLRNEDLLQLRQYSPNMALKAGDNILSIAVNAVGIDKVMSTIKSLAPDMGTDELVRQGYTKHQANQIVKGFEALTEAPNGTYEWLLRTKNLGNQIKSALNYIKNALPKNMYNMLKIHAKDRNISPDTLIKYALTAETSSYYELSFNPITGKAAAAKSGSGSSGSNEPKDNPLRQMLAGIGGQPYTMQIITRDSKSRMSVDGTYYSAIPKVKDNMSIDAMLSESGLDGMLSGNKYNITFGDLRINPLNLKDIMYSNVGGVIATLPMKVVNGGKQVNLAIKDLFDEALKEADNSGLNKESDEYAKKLGEELQKRGLNSLLDSTGRPNTNMFGQFLVVEAYTTDKVHFDNPNSQYIEEIKNPTPELESMISNGLTTDKKDPYNIDVNDNFIEFGYDRVYKGNVFIPLNNNYNAAINSWGDQLKMDDVYEYEEDYLNFLRTQKAKSSNASQLK